MTQKEHLMALFRKTKTSKEDNSVADESGTTCESSLNTTRSLSKSSNVGDGDASENPIEEAVTCNKCEAPLTGVKESKDKEPIICSSCFQPTDSSVSVKGKVEAEDLKTLNQDVKVEAEKDSEHVKAAGEAKKDSEKVEDTNEQEEKITPSEAKKDAVGLQATSGNLFSQYMKRWKRRRVIRKRRKAKIAEIRSRKAKPMNKALRWILIGLRILIMLLAAALCAFGIFFNRIMGWMHSTWPHLNMEQLTFMMRNELTGTSPEIVASGVRAAVPIAVIVFVVALAILILLSVFRRHVLFLTSSVVLAATGLIFFSVTAVETVEQLEIIQHIERQNEISDFMTTQYVNPHLYYLSFPEEPRNLIYIYVESAEVTFTDYDNGGAMSFNAIPELTQLAHAHEDFSGDSPFINGAHVLPGGAWTIAGMFSQTAGLPLNIPIPRNDMIIQDTFFPELLTLGGILEREGYYQALLIGSDAAFGGRELYYTTHGNFTIWDYYYAHDTGRIPYDHRVWWGFEDWRLFEIAREKVTEMAQGDAPFHLTMLTVDTHFPHGWVCEYCPDYFDDQMANVFLCGSAQVYDFVNWVKEQDFFENTTIIIAGDHLTMDVYFADHVTEDYERKVYVAIINSAVEVEDPTKRREFSTQDMFPTTLAALGVEIPGNRLGLGTNLFSTVPTLIEQYGFELMTRELERGSDLMDNLVADIEYDDFYAVIQNPEFVTIFPFNYETDTLSILVDESILEYLRSDEFMLQVWSQELQNDLQRIHGTRIDEGPILLNATIPAGIFWGSQVEIEVINIDLRGRRHVIYEIQMVNPHMNPYGVE